MPCHIQPLNGILSTEAQAEISVGVFGKGIVLVTEEVVCEFSLEAKHYEIVLHMHTHTYTHKPWKLLYSFVIVFIMEVMLFIGK